MAVAAMRELLDHAKKNQYAVGYFEAFNMDFMLAILDAAQETKSPAIIGFGGQFLSSQNREIQEDIYIYGALAREAAVRASVPVAILLNEADREDMIYQGMNAGFNAVMYQKSGESAGDTLRITKEICRVAHMLGIDVESEIGELPCSDIGSGTMTVGKRTDIIEAKSFFMETGIDALAVAIGNVHLLESDKSPIDFQLLSELREEIPIPLVLHGGTGIHPKDMKTAIQYGICKINVGTVLKRAYIEALGKFYTERDISRVDPHITIGWGGKDDMMASGRAAVTSKVKEFIKLFGSEGQAGLR